MFPGDEPPSFSSAGMTGSGPQQQQWPNSQIQISGYVYTQPPSYGSMDHSDGDSQNRFQYRTAYRELDQTAGTVGDTKAPSFVDVDHGKGDSYNSGGNSYGYGSGGGNSYGYGGQPPSIGDMAKVGVSLTSGDTITYGDDKAPNLSDVNRRPTSQTGVEDPDTEESVGMSLVGPEPMEIDASSASLSSRIPNSDVTVLEGHTSEVFVCAWSPAGSLLAPGDAEVVVEGISVGIHRCILATRCNFFSDLFKKNSGCVEKDGKPKYIMSELLPFGNVGHDAFLIFLSYVYTGKLKSPPIEVSTCVDDGCLHDACRPAINFAVELTYASSVFDVPELVSLFQRRLLNFVDKALVEDVIPILFVAFHCQLQHILSRCIDRVARSNLDTISIDKMLPFGVAQKVKSLRNDSQEDDEHTVESEGALREKRIKSIYKALDFDDVELVKMILIESNVTLDEACALHYAVSYCDQEVAKKVLDLNLANLHLRNSRGYTVLHVAAMRKEPSIIVSLLNKGACASDATVDGQSAVSICKRLTRPKDYHVKIEQGEETNKDRLCIDVLEREIKRKIKRNPMVADISVSSSMVANDLHMRLYYLENRVGLAKLLFPSEAKLAMEIAHAQTTLEFPGLLASKGSNGNLRDVDLNETPLVQNKRLLSRMEALSKTVETGRRYFPHCSAVLDNFMEDDMEDPQVPFFLEMATCYSEEQEIIKSRYVELKEDLQRAFTKDKAELYRALSSSMYSPTIRQI